MKQEKKIYASTSVMSDIELNGLTFPDVAIIGHINRAISSIVVNGDYPNGLDWGTFQLSVGRDSEVFDGLLIRASVESEEFG